MDRDCDGRGGADGPSATAADLEAASTIKADRLDAENAAPHVAVYVATPTVLEDADAAPSAGNDNANNDNNGDRSGGGRRWGRDDAAAETEEAAAVALESPRFKPLRAQWRYGLAVFARYKRTPYFYSGNIATYLGAGLFMVVFDDGTLNYRVKREDIVLRQYETESDENIASSSSSSSNTGGTESSVPGDTRRQSTPASPTKAAAPSPPKLSHLNWHSNSSIVYQNHTMVDFSMTPPRQFAVCDNDDSGGGGERDVLGDEVLGMKRLECGVGYEDDSTQVSDSDESSEEDMSMTPWQQMTQTFGMGKVRPRASRRSSISSLSQVDRLSLAHNGRSMTQILLPSPKGLKQTIQDFLSRKAKKVQPATLGSHVAVLEHVRLMRTRARDLAAKYASDPTFSTRVVVTRPATDGGDDNVRSYGTIKTRLPNGDVEVITEDELMISVQVVAADAVELLPSVNELNLQMRDLVHTSKKLYAGRKVQVNLYPGSRFSGHGVVTLEVASDTTFNVLLRNRIRLVNVPADKLVSLQEKKKATVTITEDQFLVCSDKAKVYIGDQVFVKCDGDYEGVVEEKVGILNGVFSNKTAAVDFADGSTGYEVAPALITKRKRPKASADTDLMSLKNAVLMQASGVGSERLEVGFHVKADHPRKASVETCVVIQTHPSTACDVRFSDGTIAFEVFPSQMILDNAERASALSAGTRSAPALLRDAVPGEYVLAWSSRFGRYCSAKVAGKAAADGVAALYTIVFDYGEQKANVPLEKLAPLDRHDALSPTQKLTNYSIDTIGFEISPVAFAVGEAVAARVHGSVQYYRGWVEMIQEKERVCAVQFDSSERDEHVPFSSMFSVDVRNRFQSVGNRIGSSSGGGSRLSHFQDEGAMAAAAAGAATTADDAVPNRRRRHSGGSVGSIIMSVAGSIFRSRKESEQAERRRGSHLITEIGAVLRRRADP